MSITEDNIIRQVINATGCEKRHAIEALNTKGNDSTAAVEWILEGLAFPTSVDDFEVE